MKAVNFIKKLMLGVMVLGMNAGIANAQLITGDMGMTGSFTTAGTAFTLGSATGTSGSGLLGTTVGFGTDGIINNGVFDYDSFTPVIGVLGIGGWQFDMNTLLNETTADDTAAGIWKFSGAGLLVDMGGEYEDTAATWILSANNVGSSYSLTITAVPVPAAAWLFGSGLLGLVGIARRKKV